MILSTGVLLRSFLTRAFLLGMIIRWYYLGFCLAMLLTDDWVCDGLFGVLEKSDLLIECLEAGSRESRLVLPGFRHNFLTGVFVSLDLR